MFGLENIVKTLENEEPKEEQNIRKAIKAYLGLRDELEKLKRKHKEEVKILDHKMTLVSDFIEKEATRQGVDSFATSEGTAYRTTLTAVGVADWDATLAYITQHEAYELLQKRVTKSVALEILEDKGELPAGLKLDRTFKFNFKR